MRQPHAATPGPDSRDDLVTREALDQLLMSFYQGAMTDDLLGPVFHGAHLDLDTHLPRIGDFWEQTLLGTGSYAGRPMAAHRQLHETLPLTPEMFDRWLEQWSSAVDLAFRGPIAEQAKSTARRIGDAMQRQLSKERTLLQIVSPHTRSIGDVA